MSEAAQSRYEIRLLGSLAEVSAKRWDELVGPNDPFSEHAFLFAMERSNAVGADAGWRPIHIGLFEGDEIVAALPLYLKSHSYGEFIFDWGWANAAVRAGVPYYPKLLSMTPFTPVVSPSFMIHSAVASERRAIITQLSEAALRLARRENLSSLHLLFLEQSEQEVLPECMIRRTTTQFHWHNQGYQSFEEYLQTFRASARKSTRRERREAGALGLRIEEKTGEQLDERDWSSLERFYRSTCAAHGSPQYLPSAFFATLASRAHARVVAFIAYDGEQPVAATLNFEKGNKLYGRYWGTDLEVPFLHFELAYYRLIERAIRLGLQTVEAGAQGMHKIKRGFLPVPIHSAHWLAHPGLHEGVSAFVHEETMHMRLEMEELAKRGPFRRASQGEKAP